MFYTPFSCTIMICTTADHAHRHSRSGSTHTSENGATVLLCYCSPHREGGLPSQRERPNTRQGYSAGIVVTLNLNVPSTLNSLRRSEPSYHPQTAAETAPAPGTHSAAPSSTISHTQANDGQRWKMRNSRFRDSEILLTTKGIRNIRPIHRFP